MARIGLLSLLSLWIAFSGPGCAAQASVATPSDADAIRAVALDYIEAWYDADAARMERAVHPELAKRWVRRGDDGVVTLQNTTAAELVEQTRRGGGNRTPEAFRRKDVEILDVTQDLASVKVTSARYVDLMHLARWNGEWKIVNVLWALRTDDASAATDGTAARRLRELIAAVDSGDPERVRAYYRDVYAPELRARNPEERVVQAYMALHDRSRGLEVISFHASETEAAALLRSRLTSIVEPLSLRVEQAPPHRVIGPASSPLAPPRHELSAAAVSDAQRIAEIDRLAKLLADADVFSGVIAIARGNEILYLGSFGKADRATGEPVRAGTRFDLASLTKMFTTVALAQLVEQGKISWDDPIGRFLPEFPLAEAREKVTIRHLVTHTSGLQESLRYCERVKCPESYPTMAAHVRLAGEAQEKTLLFEPGTRAPYTNTNFVLAGAIVERVTGQPFYEYIRRNVFRPAGMKETDFVERGGRGPRIAGKYDKRFSPDGAVFSGKAEPPRPAASYPAPFCCAHSTARDMVRFAAALQSGRLVRPETLKVLLSSKPEAGSWGYGFDVYDEERGIVGHGGSWTGISNSIELFTKSGYTVVILSNHTNGRSPLREAIRSILP